MESTPLLENWLDSASKDRFNTVEPVDQQPRA